MKLSQTNMEDMNALHEYLNELKGDLAGKDQETLPKEQLDRRRFLKKFPRVMQQLVELIGKLRELADNVDKVHRDCTISNVVSHSTSALSGALTILGLALAPVTAGASVALLATGIGLGAASAVTAVATSIVEHRQLSKAQLRQLPKEPKLRQQVMAIACLTFGNVSDTGYRNTQCPPISPEPLELDPIELTVWLRQLHSDVCKSISQKGMLTGLPILGDTGFKFTNTSSNNQDSTPPPAPRPWGITTDTIPSALNLLPAQLLCEDQRVGL
ncbi:APOL3 [Cervus elaphus hippelaphus]|uniref:APOL3 n=1 Tax=Cervus elaphus hippelaphus TaxID=46360 RepID=A0A212CDM1_CEREH|nr:APOL3 [Cervus elaphus hippelaphus]